MADTQGAQKGTYAVKVSYGVGMHSNAPTAYKMANSSL